MSYVGTQFRKQHRAVCLVGCCWLLLHKLWKEVPSLSAVWKWFQKLMATSEESRASPHQEAIAQEEVSLHDLLSRGAAAVVESNSSNLQALRQCEVFAKKLQSEAQALCTESQKAQKILLYGNKPVCHGCGKECADLASCLCFDAEKQKGQRLCSFCLEAAWGEGQSRTTKKCQSCGGFACSSASFSSCQEIVECMECHAVVLCRNCAKDDKNNFLSCRCGQFCFCSNCKDALMSKECQAALAKEHSEAKKFITDSADIVVATTCRCGSCVAAAEKQNQNGKVSYGRPGLMKIVPCGSCKELIHQSPTCDECNYGHCATLSCAECGEPEDDSICLECKKRAGPDFNWMRDWKGKRQRDISWEDWKCSRCRQYDDGFDY